MIRRLVRVALKFAVVGGAAAGAAKVLDRLRSGASNPAVVAPWPPIPEPSDAAVAPAAPVSPSEPDGSSPGVEATASASGTEASGTEATGAEANGAHLWADPDEEGTCPASHPIKAKLGSGVFHLPGMANYDRTKADRCYPDDATAEADGLRQAKR